MTTAQNIHGHWSSRLAFILAATGCAVGLGNIWGFPFKAGANGGGAFVLVYLGCVLFVGVPIMLAEVLLGRRGQANPLQSMRSAADAAGRSPLWPAVALMGILAGVLIMSFYSVIAGWTLEYLRMAVVGELGQVTRDNSGEVFSALTGSVPRQLFWHSAFLIVTVAIVARGVSGGIERAVTWLLPALALMLVGLAIYGFTLSGSSEALNYLFKPDFSKLSAILLREAMGQAFFSLSLGMGALMAYGAYIRRGEALAPTVLTIAGFDTTIALLAGLAVFPIVFTVGLAANGGPGLVFVTLPIAFAESAVGAVLAVVFFALLFVAALTSAISLTEPATAWLVEKTGGKRWVIATAIGLIIWITGLSSVLSGNVLAEFKPIANKNPMDFFVMLTFDYMLPIGGMFIAIFVSWRLPVSMLREELPEMAAAVFSVWLWLLRIVAPLSVAVVFLFATGIADWLCDSSGLLCLTTKEAE